MLDKKYDYEPIHFDDSPESLHAKYNMYFTTPPAPPSFEPNQEVNTVEVIKALSRLQMAGVEKVNVDSTIGSLFQHDLVCIPSIPAMIVFDWKDDPHTLFAGLSNGSQYKPHVATKRMLIQLNDKQLITSSFFYGMLEESLREYGYDLSVEIQGGIDNIEIVMEYQRARTRFFSNVTRCSCGGSAYVFTRNVPYNTVNNERKTYDQFESHCNDCGNIFMTPKQRMYNKQLRDNAI